MLEEILAGRRAETVLVGVGPGSFTGIRVGLAAAHGLAIGWGAKVRGMSSLALLAASCGSNGPVAAAVLGGHGELFVQEFDGGLASGPLVNAAPAEVARQVCAPLVVGSGAVQLVDARGCGEAREAWPSARLALALDPKLRDLDPRPLYARAPDAKARSAA